MQTAHKTQEEKKEHFDSEKDLDEKIERLAAMIKESKHFVAFTGAGISTGAGVPDFRSGVDTVLPTGPGAWEKLAVKDKSKPKVNVSMLKAVPTAAHMALVKLQEEGLLKFLISQNVDGLHRRSGFPPEKMAELHGNTNLEICKNPQCKKQFLRDFRTRTAQSVHEHKTGRKCICGEELYDSIINFGENLPEKDITDGFAHSEKADLCLVLGSSLKVTPAANMPYQTVQYKGKLVIVNLQSTPHDDIASFRINGMIDPVMIKLMDKLKMPIPQFKLIRRLGVRKVEKQNNFNKLVKGIDFRGVDSDGSPYSLFPKVIVEFPETSEQFILKKEPFQCFPVKTDVNKDGVVKVKLTFHGHYNEPDLTLEIPTAIIFGDKDVIFKLDFDTSNGTWEYFQQQ